MARPKPKKPSTTPEKILGAGIPAVEGEPAAEDVKVTAEIAKADIDREAGAFITTAKDRPELVAAANADADKAKAGITDVAAGVDQVDTGAGIDWGKEKYIESTSWEELYLAISNKLPGDEGEKLMDKIETIRQGDTKGIDALPMEIRSAVAKLMALEKDRAEKPAATMTPASKEPAAPEDQDKAPSFGYELARNWGELYALISGSLSEVDAKMIIENIDLYRQGKIKFIDLGSKISKESGILDAVKILENKIGLNQIDINAIETPSGEAEPQYYPAPENITDKKYIDAQSFKELYKMLDIRMPKDADMIIDQIEQYRDGEISLAQILVSDDSGIKEAIEKLLKAETSRDDIRAKYFEALRQKRGLFNLEKRKLGIGAYKDEARVEFEEVKKAYEDSKRQAILEILKEKGYQGGEIPVEILDEYIKQLKIEEEKIDELATSANRSRMQKFKGWWKRHAKARMAVGIGMLGTGLALSFTGLHALAGVKMFSTGWAVARGTSSGLGTFMAAEGAMDVRTGFLGQKGLIDQVAGTGMKRDKNTGREIIKNAIKSRVFDKYSVEELGQELARLRVLSMDKGVALENAGRFGEEQAPLVKYLQDVYYQKLKERASVKPAALAEAKPTKSANTAEQSVSAAPENSRIKEKEAELRRVESIIASINSASGEKAARDLTAFLHEKTRLENDIMALKSGKTIEEPKKDRKKSSEQPRIVGDTLADFLTTEIKTGQDALVSKQKSERIKSGVRHGLAAGLGLTVGLFTGSKVLEKIGASDKPEVIDKPGVPKGVGAADLERPLYPDTGYDAQGHPLGPLGHTEQVFNNISEVHKGDTVWDLTEDQLKQRIGDERWAALGEAKRTFLIDAIKDKVAHDPSAFGLHHDIDVLQIGEKIDFSKAFEDPNILAHLQEQAQNLSPAALENIIHNNEALREAAKAGVHITSENVDQIATAVREHGVGFLSHDGAVHDWSWQGHAVDRLSDGSFVVKDTGEHLTPDKLAEVFNHAHENAATVVAQEGVNNTQAIAEQAGAAKGTAAEIAQQNVDKFLQSPGVQYDHQLFEAAKESGHLEEVYNKLIESGNSRQLASFVRDWAGAEGLSDNKREIFLATLQHDNRIDLTVGGQVNPGDGLKALQHNLQAFEASVVNTNGQPVGEAVKAFNHLPLHKWSVVRIGDEYALAKRYEDVSSFIVKRVHWLFSFSADRHVEMSVTDKDVLSHMISKMTFGHVNRG